MMETLHEADLRRVSSFATAHAFGASQDGPRNFDFLNTDNH